MKSAKPKSGFSKLRFVYLLLIVAILASIGCYGWRVYALFRDARLNMPQPQVNKLLKDLRLFHSRTKRFPQSFNEINSLIWHTQPAPDYGAEGRQAITKNYYYFYTKVSDDQSVFWAIPLGPQRHYAATFFLVLSPNWERVWQGKALDEAFISRLSAIPAPEELANYRLVETARRN